eukprot:m.287435 g.287435  ORF g.287435 m.287435 type:complete len:644 (-) comp55017_c0_seq7:222-2153(-)
MAGARVTPLPMGIVLVVSLALFINSVIMTLPFPYLPFLIRDYVTEDESRVGYYVGMVASAMFFGRMIASYAWGRAADTWGRRPTAILSIFLMSVSTLLFGLSTTFPTAVASRCITGMVAGVVPIAKTALSEVTDNTNQAKGMTVITTSWGLGLVVGSAMGGLLADPNLIARIDSPFFNAYPYVFPSLVACCGGLVTTILALIWMEETIHLKKKKVEVIALEGRTAAVAETAPAVVHLEDVVIDSDGSHGSDGDQESDGDFEQLIPSAKSPQERKPKKKVTFFKRAKHSRVKPLVHSDTTSTAFPETNIDQVTRHSTARAQHSARSSGDVQEDERVLLVQSDEEEERSSHVITTGSSAVADTDHAPKKKQGVFMQLMSDPIVLKVVVIYAIFSFAAIGLDELYPLWASTSLAKGGLSWTQQQIGNSMGITGLILVVVQICFYPMCERRFGALKIFHFCAWGCVLVTPFLPLLSLLQHTINNPTSTTPSWTLLTTTPVDYNDTTTTFTDSWNTTTFTDSWTTVSTTTAPVFVENGISLWVGIVILSALNRVFFGTVFISTSLFINNCVPSERRGAINGLSMTTTAALRSIAPVFTGSVFAWSISSGHGYPLNSHLAFILLTISFVVAALLGLRLPASLNKQYVES